jgi:pimeloyl-ACP methyl ester carboxylesterase
MAFAQVNGVELGYDTVGEDGDPALLLVHGLGTQMIGWDDAFCGALADRGLFVIRYDNRDVGLSTKSEPPVPVVLPPDRPGVGFRLGSDPPYTLADLADDGIALLDHLGLPAAHVVGASMGGMIAQQMAFRHPDRVMSLTSIMSTTGDPEVGKATGAAIAALMAVPPAEREAYVEHAVRNWRVLSGPLFDEQRTRRRAAASFDRSFHPIGSAFQFAAIVADGDRTERLKDVHCPTLVIHGAVDPLITLSGGEATAAAIPGARLLVLDEMGHDLPEPLWPQLIDAIAGHTLGI